MTGREATWRDVVGRGLMALASAGATGAFLSGLSAVRAAAPERVWIELWRTLGFLVFAGMFALLAARPRTSAGVWELAFGHKAAMAVAQPFVGAVPEAAESASVDIVLATIIAVAYVCARGWRSWLSREAPANVEDGRVNRADAGWRWLPIDGPRNECGRARSARTVG